MAAGERRVRPCEAASPLPTAGQVRKFSTACGRSTCKRHLLAGHRCARCAARQVLVPPVRNLGRCCGGCALAVPVRLFLPRGRSQPFSSGPHSSCVSLLAPALLFSAVVFLFTSSGFAPASPGFSSYTIPPPLSQFGNTVTPSVVLASAVNMFPASREGDSVAYHRDGETFPSIPFRSSLYLWKSPLFFPKWPGVGLYPDLSSKSGRNGRRLAASGSDEAAPENEKARPHLVIPVPRRGSAGAMLPPSSPVRVPGDSRGRASTADRLHFPDFPGSFSVDETDADAAAAPAPARRSTSYTHAPPSPVPSEPLMMAPIPPPRRRKTNASREGGQSPAPPAPPPKQQDSHLSESVPGNFPFHALLREKPSSLAEKLWTEVAETEKSAFAEMGVKKASGGGKAGSLGRKSDSGGAELRVPSEESTSPRGVRRSLPEEWRVGPKAGDESKSTGKSKGASSGATGLKRPSSFPRKRRDRRGRSRSRDTLESLFAAQPPKSGKHGRASGSSVSELEDDIQHALASQAPLPASFLDTPLALRRSHSEDDRGSTGSGLALAASGGYTDDDETLGRSASMDFSAASEDNEDYDIPPSRRPRGIDGSPGGGGGGGGGHQPGSLTPDREHADEDGEGSSDFIKLLFRTYYMYLKRDVRLRRQFALLVLSSVQWPLYTRSSKWRRPKLQKWFSQLYQLATETLPLEEECHFGNILREEITELGWILRSLEDFERFLRGQSRVDLHLRYMLTYVPGHRLAIRLTPEVLQEVYNEVTSLQLNYYYLAGLNDSQATSLVQWNFIHEAHLRWSMLQLLGITQQVVTLKPLTGVLILQVDKIDAQEEQVRKLFESEENKVTQEGLVKFETLVTSALTLRIQSVAKNFDKIFSTSEYKRQSDFQLPTCQVTAFYLKPERSRKAKQQQAADPAAEDAAGEGGADAEGDPPSVPEAIETGLFGFEMDINIAKELKDMLPVGSMYIQLSLVDPWAYTPTYKPPSNDPNVIPAYRATQILKANLEHDPSLMRVGITKVVYTTVVDAYNSSAPNPTGYDNDRHLVLRVPLSEFHSEEAFLEALIGMASVPSLQNSAPGTLNPRRIKLVGSARRLVQGEVLKTGNFLSGIDYRRHKSIESAIEVDTVAVHVLLEGLKEKSTMSAFELPATTIFDRLVRRGRSRFTVMHAEIVPKKTHAGARGQAASQRTGQYPAWVLVVSNLCVAIFFLIVLASLLLNRHAKLPWWIACICGPQNPFVPEPENRRDSLADHSDAIASMAKRRATLFARSRSMLVSGIGPRKSEWATSDSEQRTRSTGEARGSVDTNPDSFSRSRSKRSSAVYSGHDSSRRGFDTGAASLSRKGSFYFRKRGSQQRQGTNQLANMVPDDVEISGDTAPASNTVPTLRATPTSSTDISAGTDASARVCRSSSAQLEDVPGPPGEGGSRKSLKREKSAPPTDRAPTARSKTPRQRSSSSGTALAPLRTLELARSYRRERRVHPAMSTNYQPNAQTRFTTHGAERSGNAGGRLGHDSVGHHRESPRPADARISHDVYSSVGGPHDAPPAPAFRCVRIASTSAAVEDEGAPTTPLGERRSPGAIV